jgi:molecular chaperone DnaK
VPQIEVTFDIDANGILNVSARDKATNQEQKITITATTNLTEGEVEDLVKEAKRHEAEDRRRKELVEARNTADQIIYQMEKMLRDYGDQISGSDRDRIQQSIEDLKHAKQGDDTSRIRSLIEQLQQASQAIGQQMYAQQAGAQQAGAQQAGPGAGPGAGSQAGSSSEGGGEEDVVEGDFREV